MNSEELLTKIKKIKSNLQNANAQLNKAKAVLNDSITFDGEGFKINSISDLNSKLNTQINNIDNKIIPKINSM